MNGVKRSEVNEDEMFHHLVFWAWNGADSVFLQLINLHLHYGGRACSVCSK